MVRPLTTTIGARIDGIDLRQPIGEADAAVIRQALADHFVIVFRGQPIDLAQQKAVASIFGPLGTAEAHRLAGDTDPATVLDNALYAVVDDAQLPSVFNSRDEYQDWHVDSSFCDQIPSIACLRAEVLPPYGGGTSWASMARAYDALSPTMAEWLETLSAVFAPPTGYRAAVGVDKLPAAVQREWDARFTSKLHPLVTRHPVSGRKMLWLNPVYVVKIHGLANGESAMLLRHLYQHCTQPDFVYRHLWEADDIIIWDELATMHRAPKDYMPHPRRVVRVFAGLTTPTAAREMSVG
jgi:taurine dioxygenase